jgi:hypothetical protein
MNAFLKRAVIIIAAILLGIGSFYFINGWYNVIPWIIAALIIGYVSFGQKDIIMNGALFGYFLFVVYIFVGYSGNRDSSSMVKIISFSLLFSFVGAIAGVAGAFIGNWLRQVKERQKTKKIDGNG